MDMPTFAERDCAAMLDLVADMQAAPRRAEVRVHFLARLQKLIPSEFGGCHVFLPGEPRIEPCYEPNRPSYPAFNPEFLSLIETHPLTPVLRRHPGQTWCISDVASTAVFRRTDFYNLLYRPIGVDRELVTMRPLSGRPGAFLVASLHRRGSDFSERDRKLMNLLAPYLQRAVERFVAAASGKAGAQTNGRDFQAFTQRINSCANWRLRPRELEVLFWLSQGKTNAEIGAVLGISERTAETHALNVYPKMGVENRYGAIAEVMQMMNGG